ncbi:MAG: alpha-1,2-fucosyltransferase, partial [Rhodomicrobium sp.]
GILCLRGNVKLNGYWQCERYFSDIAGIIREDLTLHGALTGRDRDVLDRIRSAPSAFIHVRRGDYVTHPVFSEKFAACSLGYYREALTLLRERVGLGLQFFVFSNDPGWVREMKIGGEDAEIIDWNADTPERDLALMRECSHAVIANSSFSWWGAWLGDSRERIVIAPRTWFRHQSSSHDIVPERWLKLG